MSLILKGIDLPKEYYYISIAILKDGSIFKQDENDGCYYQTGYKAIQIPKGARLIDANELSKEVEIEIEDFLTESGIRSVIRNAPTILESEEE